VHWVRPDQRPGRQVESHRNFHPYYPYVVVHYLDVPTWGVRHQGPKGDSKARSTLGVEHQAAAEWDDPTHSLDVRVVVEWDVPSCSSAVAAEHLRPLHQSDVEWDEWSLVPKVRLFLWVVVLRPQHCFAQP
jgi:hypothetical protein